MEFGSLRLFCGKRRISGKSKIHFLRREEGRVPIDRRHLQLVQRLPCLPWRRDEGGHFGDGQKVGRDRNVHREEFGRGDGRD